MAPFRYVARRREERAAAAAAAAALEQAAAANAVIQASQAPAVVPATRMAGQLPAEVPVVAAAIEAAAQRQLEESRFSAVLDREALLAQNRMMRSVPEQERVAAVRNAGTGWSGWIPTYGLEDV